MPPDFALPIQEILLRTTCELKEALSSLQLPEYQRFNPRQWVINVSLQPKVDTNVNFSGGWTRKVPYENSPARFVTWALSTPGLQLDLKGQRSGSITFAFDSSGQLMDDKDLDCTVSTPSLHALAQHLGVGSWLRRTAVALSVAPSAKPDKPTYNTTVTIKFAANGSYTFTFPPGTDLAALSGSYTLEEQLNISMVPIPPKPKPIVVVTLPQGDNFGRPVSRVIFAPVVTPLDDAKRRLDVIELEQAIRNLQVRPQ